MRWVIAAAIAFAGPALAQDIDRGAQLYLDNCVVCHGLGLAGDGPMAEILVIPPPDLARITARYGEFPSVGIAWLIDGRDPLASHGGEMPVFGRVFGEMSEVMTATGGQTIVTSPEVVDLVAYLESVQIVE